VLNNAAGNAVSGLFANAPQTITAGLFTFAVSYGANADGLGGIAQPNDVALIAIAVPEPSTYALLILTGAIFAAAARKDRRA
jgi:hypothetical protein